MAELDNLGTWTDYIYANGQKIAKVDSAKTLLHLHGVRDGSINMGYGVEGPMSGSLGGGAAIGTRDKLVYDFKQTLPSYGDLALILNNDTLGAGDLIDEATGVNTFFDSQADGQWHHITAKLDEYAGSTLSYPYIGLHNSMPAGTFDMYFANVMILHADGSVTPIYTGQGAGVPAFSGTPGGAYNCTSGSDLTPTPDSAVNTNYYLDDHLGTAQMELSPGGWPMWQGQFTRFGQEIVNGQTDNLLGQQPADGTSMRYKFTGKERDAESGLDYFGARYYASSMGRWMSPDWSAKGRACSYAKLDEPQSLNLYGYVGNNPLSRADADGHCWPACTMAAGAAIGALAGVRAEAFHEWRGGHGLDTGRLEHAAAGGAVAGLIAGAAGPAGGAVVTALFAAGGSVAGGMVQRAGDGEKVLNGKAMAVDAVAGAAGGALGAKVEQVIPKVGAGWTNELKPGQTGIKATLRNETDAAVSNTGRGAGRQVLNTAGNTALNHAGNVAKDHLDKKQNQQ